MNQLRYGFAFVLTGSFMLLGACGGLEEGQQSSERTSTAISSVLVQSCPGYGSCASWSGWEAVGTPYCTSSGHCGYVCDPLPGRPEYCDTQILHTDECCNFVPDVETATTIQRYQWCWNFVGDMCEQIEQDEGFVGCGC